MRQADGTRVTDDTYFVVRYSPARIKCDGCGVLMGNRGGCGPYIVVGHPHVRNEVRGRACSNECVPAILARPIEFAANRRNPPNG